MSTPDPIEAGPGVLSAEGFSVNEEAERLLGRRLTPEQESGEAPGVIPFDYPVELGYQCPIHKRTMDDADKAKVEVGDGGGIVYTHDAVPLLEWSEYRSFLWCAECNIDWPSALCVPLGPKPDAMPEWQMQGPADAIRIFLAAISDAVRRAATAPGEPTGDEEGQT